MYFTLEVLQAAQGDCLLLHYGKTTDPKIIVIDGGPSGIYHHFLKPRLLEIKASRSPEKALPLSLVMVSHMDDDHANGICMLTDEIIENGNTADFAMKHLWVNTFDDIVGNIQLPAISAIEPSGKPAGISSFGIPVLTATDEDASAVIASTGQGRLLRNNAKVMSVTLNHPFKQMAENDAVLVRGDTGESVVKWDQLKITVVSPNDKRLTRLQKQWDKDLKKAHAEGDASIIFASILDNSPFNVSSIACLVELNGKKILLTGDGRSDDIFNGLESNNKLDSNGKIHVDILKMPHHGSIRNMRKEFLENVTADHYVISADGSNDNPDKALLDLLVSTVHKGTLHLTNRTGEKNIEENINAFLTEIANSGSILKVAFPDGGKNSMVINLLSPINF